VVPYGLFDSQAGRVTAVWPAIGMIDVEMANGNKRYPVEDLQLMDGDGLSSPPETVSTPGGQGSVSVPGGPDTTPTGKSARRVARAYTKKAIYWVDRDRQYRMSGQEMTTGRPTCPRCHEDTGSPALKRAVYKRRDGSSLRLLGCPGCMFLIKDTDIVNNGPVEIEIEGAG